MIRKYESGQPTNQTPDATIATATIATLQKTRAFSCFSLGALTPALMWFVCPVSYRKQ